MQTASRASRLVTCQCGEPILHSDGCATIEISDNVGLRACRKYGRANQDNYRKRTRSALTRPFSYPPPLGLRPKLFEGSTFTTPYRQHHLITIASADASGTTPLLLKLSNKAWKVSGARDVILAAKPHRSNIRTAMKMNRETAIKNYVN